MSGVRPPHRGDEDRQVRLMVGPQGNPRAERAAGQIGSDVQIVKCWTRTACGQTRRAALPVGLAVGICFGGGGGAGRCLASRCPSIPICMTAIRPIRSGTIRCRPGRMRLGILRGVRRLRPCTSRRRKNLIRTIWGWTTDRRSPMRARPSHRRRVGLLGPMVRQRRPRVRLGRGPRHHHRGHHHRATRRG